MALRGGTGGWGAAGTAVDFNAAWPRARARAAAALGARGVQRADAEDLLQDVAVRALREGDRFVSEEHLARWCRRVALNLHVDTLRRRRRLSPLPPPDAPGSDDTATAVERRIALRRLAAGVAELSPDERQLLFDPAPAASRQEAVRLAVRRHRLRARLAELVEGLAAGIAFVRRLDKTLSPPAKASVVAAPLVVATLLVGPLALGPHTSRPEPVTRPHAGGGLAFAARQPARRSAAGPRVSPASTSREVRPATMPAPTRPSPRTIVHVAAGGQPIAVEHWHNDDGLRLCTGGLANVCVSRSRPQVPAPTIPGVTPPGG